MQLLIQYQLFSTVNVRKISLLNYQLQKNIFTHFFVGKYWSNLREKMQIRINISILNCTVKCEKNRVLSINTEKIFSQSCFVGQYLHECKLNGIIVYCIN